jgi:heat shock protein HslJ
LIVTINKRLVVSVFGLVLLVLAACSPAAPQPTIGASQIPVANGSLANTEWRLESFGSTGAVESVLPGSTITLRFDENGLASGSGGCNTYSAGYQVQDGKLSFSEVTSTEMACAEEGVTRQEQRYFQALQAAGSFELSGDRLVISDANGQGVLNFIRSETVATEKPTSEATSAPAEPPTPGETTEPAKAPTSAPTPPTEQPTPAPERIHFETGATSATVTGHLQASGSDLYVLSASGGQTMSVELSFTQGRAILVVWGADGTVLMSDHAEASQFSGVLPSTQDYYILLKGRPDGSTDYSMTVTIPPLGSNQPTPAPERIHFQAGATSATVTGHLQASGSDQYVLAALGGQTMTVDLSFTQGQAILAVWGADGTVLMSDHAEASSFSSILPSTQDYYILVRGRPDGETVYRMDVNIPPLGGN